MRNSATGHVRFTPESGHVQRISSCLLWANSGHVAFIFTRQHSAARSPERRKRWILVSGRGRVKSTHVQRKSYPLRATNRNALSHSINWSARPISVLGTLRLSVLAVLRLITSSYLVGACTGRSAGFSPLRMRST